MPKLIHPQPGTTGFYLRELRKFYTLKQSDIADINITESKVVRIELNKDAIVTESDCKAIANNIIRKVGDNLKEDKEFLYLYFYDHDKYLAAEKAQGIFKILHSNFNNDYYDRFLENFKLLEDIFINYDIPQIKIKSFMLAAIFDEKKSDFNRAYLYASRALDNALLIKDIESQINASIKLAKYLYYMGKYTKCIDRCNGILKKYNKSMNDTQYSYVYYNLAHSYRKEDKCDLALNNFEILNKYIKQDNIYQYSDVQNSIALCYLKQRLHDKAIQTLLNLLTILNSKYPIQQANTHDNLIDVYKDIKDLDNIRLHANSLRLIIPQIDRSENLNYSINHASQLYYNLANAYKIINEFDYSEAFYNKSIELSKIKNNTELQYKCLLELFDLYITFDKKTRINLLATNLLEALTNISIKEDNRFILKILKNFIIENKADECTNIINLLLKEDSK